MLDGGSMRRGVLALMIAMLMFKVSSAQPSQSESSPLHALFAAEWDYDSQQSPESASERGDRRWNDRWSDQTLAAIAQRNQHYQDVLVRLSKIDRSKLSAADQLNYDLFQKRY